MTHNNFVNNAYYSMLYGTNDFAQSFITSEWMYNSLEGAGNIDLAPISMSFFKSVEQFLFLYVSRHTSDIDQNDERTIYDSYLKKDEPLTSDYLQRKKKYITLGPLCGFFGRNEHGRLIKKNRDLLYQEIKDPTYDFIIN